MPVRPITGSGFSSLPTPEVEVTLPTPTVFHTTMNDESIETFEARQAKSSTGQIGKSLGVALRYEIGDDGLLRTPSVTDSTGGAISENQARERGRMVKVADQAAQLAFENGLKVSPSITEQLGGGHLMPTPNTMDFMPARSPEKISESKKRQPGGYANLRETVVNEIISDTNDKGL
jgi:hypothetical protein